MSKSAATITLPIYTKFDGKDFHIGDVTMDLKFRNGKPQAPTSREFIAALKRVR